MIFVLECLESYELKNINLKNQDSNTKKKCIAVLQRKPSKVEPTADTKIFGILRLGAAFSQYVFCNI